MVMAIGHCSTCAPAVAVHCMNMEDQGIPTAPLVTQAFQELVGAIAYKAGMPKLRFNFVPHPIGGKPASVLKEYVLGVDPTTLRPLIDQIFDSLTSDLTQEESAVGQLQRLQSRLVGANSEDELQDLFRDAWWSDGLPVVLPTPDRVSAMLKATKHNAD